MLARAIFWTAAAKLAWGQVGYGLFLAVLRRARGNPPVAPGGEIGTPAVSLIIAAYNEEAVIADKVANALALDWPRDRLELIVAVDGGAEPGADATAARAKAAGADRVLALPRGGKVRAQDAAVAAFVRRAAGVLGRERRLGAGRAAALLTPFADPQVGYVCGQVRFVNDGRHQPGGPVLALRDVAARERVRARLRDRRQRRDLRAAAGRVHARGRRHGARPVVPVRRRQARPARRLRARGARDGEDGAVDRGRGRAQAAHDEPRVADRPARRHALAARLPAALRADDRLARILRYASPLLHVAAAGATLALLRQGRIYRAAALAQAGLLAAAAAGGRVRLRPALVARYYVATTASLAAGLYDHLRHGTPAGWEAPEGTR